MCPSKMKQTILLLSCFVALVTADRVVMTSNGLLQGVTVFSGEMEVEAFLGVPFTEPPIGDLRFKKPVPKGPWNGVYNAFQQPPSCMQYLMNTSIEPNAENMSEDCLFLNLWVPYSSRTTQLKPIIMYIHGGAFSGGSSNMPLYDGTNMAKFGDVIVANMNYRVGALGFFLAYNEEAEGSMGIYDQILAMKWIKDNALAFGGNPNHIVLMGHSSGSMIVGAHTASPLTKNLFKRVIMLSGSPLIPVILDENKKLFANSQRLAEVVGCANKTLTLKQNASAIMQCMRRLHPQKLNKAEVSLRMSSIIPFYPRTGDAYLPKAVVHYLKEGRFMDTEMLIGVNEMEGSFLLATAVPDYFGKGWSGNLSRRLAYQLTRTMFEFFDKDNSKIIASHYIDYMQNTTTETYMQRMARAFGDYGVDCDSYFHAEYHSIRNPVYYYVFTHRPSTSPHAQWMGVTHVDDVQYIFGNSMFGNFTAEEAALSERMMARWVAFAKTGIPDIPGYLKWPKFTREDPVYMDINLKNSVRLRPEGYRCEFWRESFLANFDDEIVGKIKRSMNGGVQVAVRAVLVVACVSFCAIFRNL